MQSKLPVRIARKQTHMDKSNCCCAQLLKIIINNPLDSEDKYNNRKGAPATVFLSENKSIRSRSSQTDRFDYNSENDKNIYNDIKVLLMSINSTLEQILNTLQGKKEMLYNKLQEETAPLSSKLSKTLCGRNVEKMKKKNLLLGKRCAFAWPEISRLYFGQPFWMRHHCQKYTNGILPTNSSLVVSPKQQTWVCNRPLSCSNINYFQPIEQIMQQSTFSLTLPNPIFALIGRGDSNPEQEDNYTNTKDESKSSTTLVAQVEN